MRIHFRHALLASLLFAPGTLAAQTQFRMWRTCSVGALRACNGIFISTTPQFTGSVRTGTDITIKLQNLQGTDPLDNTGGSVLRNVGWAYRTHNGSSTRTSGNPGVNAVPTGPGASGSGFWEWESQSQSLPFLSYIQSTFKNPIQGCDQANIPFISFPASLRTCGPDAWMVFSAGVATILDAEDFEDGLVENMDNAGNNYQCNLFGNDGCVVYSEVTPEPMTVILFGSGLLGIAGARLRRRKPEELTSG